MSVNLSNLAIADDIQVGKDTLGGGGPMESGVYTATVKGAYFKNSEGGALSANVHLDIDGRELRQQLWIQSGNAKGNRNFYTDSQGNKKYLPGFELFRSLTLMTLGLEPNALDTEDGIMKLWSSAEGKEIPTEVPMARQLIGKTVQVGLLRQKVDKTQRNDAGDYVPTGETREENEIDKFFHAETGQTLVEAMSESNANFIEDWKRKWEGQTRDRTSKDSAAAAATAPAGFGATKAPVKSLFGS